MSSVWSILAIRRVLSQLQPTRDGRIMSEDDLESCILTLELVQREFVTLGTIGRLSAAEVSCRCVVGALRLLCQLKADLKPQTPNSSHRQLCGRRSIIILTPYRIYLLVGITHRHDTSAALSLPIVPNVTNSRWTNSRVRIQYF